MSSMSRKPRPNDDTLISGTSAATFHTDRSPNCAVASRTYTGTVTSASPSATRNAIETARSRAPSTREATGRATIVRSTNSPSAAIAVRNDSQRATSSDGVAAVSVSDGIANSGGGPAFGPIENVNAPRTGWPSAEMARQKTRYQPSARCFSGTSIVYGSVFERCGDPVVCRTPSLSVTETIAKRGSTTSS